jgi:dTDP-4-dehydrorhamnose reductase
MRIAVTGTSGQIAQALLEQAPRAGVTVVPVGRPALDLLQPEGILAALAAVKPDAIVSAAAYTAVDRAESEPDIAHAINGRGAGVVAAAAAMLGIPVVHLSTDYVFDGSKPEPWVESDPIRPLNVYGASKLAGELAVAAETANYAILRIAWVFSPFSTNFVRTMLRLAETRDRVRVVADQHGGPSSALDIADAVITVARRLCEHAEPRLRGVFHLGTSGEATWADFAEAVFGGLAARGGPRVLVERVTTAEYPTPAKRPLNSRLGSDLIASIHGVKLRPWQAALEPVLDRLVGGQ